jgi:hypothetical protein
MQFNPADLTNSIVGDIDFLLFGSSVFNSDYSLIDRARNTNKVWDEAIAEMFKADPNFKFDDTTNTDFPIAIIDLTANLDHYTLPDSALVIHRVRIKDRNGKYVTLDSVLRSELSDSELEATGTPTQYYKQGGAIFPVPIPDYGYAAGVEVELQRGGNYFASTDTDKAPGFNTQYHQFLSVGASLLYAIANGMDKKASALSALKEQIRSKMLEHYQLRSPDRPPQIKLKKESTARYGL